MNPFEEYIQSIVAPAGKERDVFRPTTLKEYVGQEDVKYLLGIAIKAAQKEKRLLPNTMITGEFGLGKTTLATLMVKEFGQTPKLIDGASVNKELPTGLVIIDEIHNLTPEVCDSLNMSIDNGLVSVIGCTTNPGVLPGAFRSRFRIHQLTRYSAEELALIAANICKRKGVTADKPILLEIAKRSRSNPRQLTNLLSQVFDLMSVEGKKFMVAGLVNKTFTLLGVDENGYLERDKAYVNVLPVRAVGLNYLSSMLGIDQTTIQEEIEPYLLQTGVIDRTPKGRIKIRDI